MDIASWTAIITSCAAVIASVIAIRQARIAAVAASASQRQAIAAEEQTRLLRVQIDEGRPGNRQSRALGVATSRAGPRPAQGVI